jgi:hypothetical protein
VHQDSDNAAPADDNPFAAPTAGVAESSFFKSVATRLTFRELWWNTRPNVLSFAIVSLFKLLRVRLPAPFGFAPENLRLIDVAELPVGPQRAMADQIAACARLGFTPRLAEVVPCAGDAEGYGVILANRERSMCAMVNCVRFIRRIEVQVTFTSRLSNGLRISTTNAPRRLLAPPDFESLYLPGTSADDLLRAQQLRLLEIGDAWPVVMDDEGLRQFIRENERLSREFHLGRGVWARMTIAEVDRLRAAATHTLE